MTLSIRSVLLSATAFSALGLAPAIASAQTAPTPTPAPATAAATPPAAAPAAATETIVVTGSRISRSTFSSASPLTVITTQNAQLSGRTDAVSILQSSTAAAGSTQTNNFFSGFNVEGGPGIRTVGLNSLGDQRTLVLINGRRLPPSGVRGQVNAVDLAVVPSLAVDRFEILNEGASPIYGSDAVGGVVNAIVRKDVNGLEISGSAGGPFAGGGEGLTIGAVWGRTADRSNFMVAGSYSEQFALKLGDRDYCSQDYVFNAATGARADYIDPRTGDFRCFGQSATVQTAWISLAGANAIAGQGTWVADPRVTTRTVAVSPAARVIQPGEAGYVAPTGTRCIAFNGTNVTCASQTQLLTVPGYRRLVNPQFGTRGEPIANQLQYESELQKRTDLQSPAQVINLYGTFSRDVDFFGGTELFGEALYSNRKSSQERVAQFFPTVTAANVYNPFGVTAQPVSVRPADGNQDIQAWQILGGAKGQTGNGLNGFMKNGRWEVYAQTSSSEGEYGGTTILQDRINATLQTTIVNGVATCPTPVLSGGTCLPINFLAPNLSNGIYTDAEFDYLFNGPNNVGNTKYEQTIVEGNVSGDVFQVPGAADAVKVNLGLHYRTYSINDVPGAETLRQNTAFFTGAGITKGTDSVKEVYGEIAAPLLARKPLAESLEVLLAYRYTDYDSYDANSTWKATLNWKITPEFAFIAIAGTSYRAPALFELFLGDQTSFANQTTIDPCINHDLSSNLILKERCLADGVPGDYNGFTNGSNQSATVIAGGGLGVLKEEESRSDIFSFVYTPSKIDLNLRIDAWKISVTDQVAQFGSTAIVRTCYTDTTGRAASFCPLFKRDNDPTSGRFRQILSVNNDYVNINVTEVQGIDLKFVYRKDFAFGDLTVDSQHRWTTKVAEGLFSDEELLDFAGEIGNPIYVSQTQVRFQRKDWTYTWSIDATGTSNNTRFNNGVNPIASAPGSYYYFNGVDSVLYKTKLETHIIHGFSVRYRSDNWTVIGGINNLFDEYPPSVSTNVAGARLENYALTSQYDLRGRLFTATVTRRF